jgi:hypothetical protein
MNLSEGVTGEFAVEIALSKFPTEQTMIYHVQTCVQPYIFKSELIYIGILKVYTKTNGFAMLFYVHAALEHVQAMYEPGTYIKCTNLSVYVHIS